ncbi:hypothetical protein [Aureliella helgolandensis]|uniref:Uncharacterized protein n=1 Tax=Aureliella helgolandensis TaxID=2527968 RepID=A0A518G5I6_9BACT|nr:hypothetical protein [Aureliella helgolandensis]QDV23857.1 hypothetical protein Q31a_21640 [Aureliella helgolandensis]
MSDETNTSQTPVARGFRFSLGTMLLWIAIGALTTNTIIMNRLVTQLRNEVASQQPLSPKEVARQFEMGATLGPITTTVKDVRYSPEADAYRVKFSWVDAASGNTWHSDIQLEHDGFGVYYGQIRNGPFIQPLGYTESFPVAVETRSSFED